MKTFNIWVHIPGQTFGPTGPWKFLQAVVVENEIKALRIATSRFGGLPSSYAIYEGV